MAYKEFGATIAPSNVSSTGFPIAMGTHIGGGRIVNDKSTLNSKQWCLLGEGATLNDQKANAIGQIWYDTLDNKYWKLDSWASANPVWVDVSTIFATRSYVDDAIENIPDPMIFKGSLGTGGTITSLPTASTSNTGFTYKVITAGTYAGQVAKVGDTFISDGTIWNLIPSGDEPGGTVTSITLNATSPILIDDSNAITTSGTRTFSHASTSGNKHIPSGGTTNQILRWTADGTADWSNEVNTHYTSKNIVSSSATGITNTNTTNPYFNHIEESTITSSHRINGSGATTVSSDVGGNITISSTDTNTTYSFATGTTNGTFNVTPLGGSATAISIYGLGSAAYTSSTNYASSSHNHSVFTTTEDGFVPKSVTSNTTDFLRRDGTWATPTTYSLPLASSGTRGGIQIGFTASGANLPLLLSSEKGYVTLTSSSITTGLGYTPYNSTNPNGYTTNTGTVTSIGMSVPAGLSVTPSSITTSGTFAISYTSGYSLPTTASQGNWDTAYSNRITSLTTTGNSGVSTLTSNILNIPNYTLSGLGGQPQLNGTGFVKVSGTTVSYDNSTYAPSSHVGSGGTSHANVTTTTNGFMIAADKLKLDELLSSNTATLPATIGWYRIATSTVGIERCAARFEIDWVLSGVHGQVTLNAGIMYGSDPTLNMIQYVHYSTAGLTKARIVYHTTYSGNYAYLEVYNSGANAIVVNVQMFSSLGWRLITPSTAGSVPSGYSTQELPFYDGIVTEGQLVSNVSTGTSPLVVSSTTMVSNLNADFLEGQHGSYYLDYTNFTNKPAAYTLPLAASGTRGGVQIGFTASGANLPLLLSSEKGYISLTSSAITSALGFTPISGDYLPISGGVISGDIDPDSDGAYYLGGGTLTGNAWKSVAAYDMYANTFNGALSGNATTATTLQTARNLTIGTTAKSFDGSANVSWTLSEIGAQGIQSSSVDADTYGDVTYTLSNHINNVTKFSHTTGFTRLSIVEGTGYTTNTYESSLIFKVNSSSFTGYTYPPSVKRVGTTPIWVLGKTYIITIWNGLLFIGELE